MKKKRKANRKEVGFLWPVIVFTMLIVGMIIYSGIHISAAGAKMAELEKEERDLVAKKNELSDDLIRRTSLLSVSEKAQEMGFVKPEIVIYAEREEVAAILP